SPVAERLESRKGGRGHGCCLHSREVCRLEREVALGRTGVSGEGTLARAEDVVPRTKLCDILADRLDLSRDIHAANTNVGRANSKTHDTEHVRKAGHDVPVTDMEAGRVNA